MRILLFLFLTLMSINAWATPDDIIPVEYSASGAVKAAPGRVYSVVYNYRGVVAGDRIFIYDSLSASGTIRLTLTASATAGSQIVRYPVGAYFGTGIYYQEETTHGGTIKTDIQSF